MSDNILSIEEENKMVNAPSEQEEIAILNELDKEKELEIKVISAEKKSVPMRETEELVDDYQSMKKQIADMKKQQDAIKKELEARITKTAYTSDKYMVYFDEVKSMRLNSDLVEAFVTKHGANINDVKKESISKTLRIKERK